MNDDFFISAPQLKRDPLGSPLRKLASDLTSGLIALIAFLPSCASRYSAAAQDPHATSCAGSLSADTTVHDTTEVSERPFVRSGPLLTYPETAREQGVRGRVIVAVVVNQDGSVPWDSVRIVRGLEWRLDAEAVRWARSATYWPGCIGAKAVRVRIAQPVDFKISGRP